MGVDIERGECRKSVKLSSRRLLLALDSVAMPLDMARDWMGGERDSERVHRLRAWCPIAMVGNEDFIGLSSVNINCLMAVGEEVINLVPWLCCLAIC